MTTSSELEGPKSCEELTSYPELDGPFGSWPMDLMFGDIQTKFKSRKPVHNEGHAYIEVLDNKYAFKRFHYGDILKEIRMSLLAGPDCSVPVLGRLFDEHELIGFIMPCGQPLAPNDVTGADPILRPKFSRDEKRDIIYKIGRLMERLHAKGILHGDVKLPNFLLCSDGEVRLCDWALACMEGETRPPGATSVHYSSPRRCTESGPISKAEDLHATGVSIWEIWVEEIPFQDIDDDLLEDVIMAGLKPDLDRVDDPAIAALIASYLDAGPPPLLEYGLSRGLCTEIEVVFGSCACQPPHSETRLVKCMFCRESRDEEKAVQQVRNKVVVEMEVEVEVEMEVVVDVEGEEIKMRETYVEVQVQEMEMEMEDEDEDEVEVQVEVGEWQQCRKPFRMPIPQVDSTSKCPKCD